MPFPSRRIKLLVVISLLFSLFLPQSVFAVQKTILPSPANGITEAECKTKIDEISNATSSKDAFAAKSATEKQDILACAVKTGRIKLWMIPYFITYVANFLIQIAGLISVLFVLIGGYLYMTGGISEQKDKAKKTILYALVGLALTILAWVIVNIVQTMVTS